MTEFIKLEVKTKNNAKLTLFNVKENKSHNWLVQYINKRLTNKWFSDYKTAKEYYDIRSKENQFK